MTKDVILTVSGIQYAITGPDEEPEAVEVILPGKYYKKNGQHYLLYDELVEGTTQATHNIVKFDDTKMEVLRKGAINVQMNFENNKKNVSYYQTPFGVMNMGIATTRLQVQESESTIAVAAEYALDLNDEYVADCRLAIKAHGTAVGLPSDDDMGNSEVGQGAV